MSIRSRDIPPRLWARMTAPLSPTGPAPESFTIILPLPPKSLSPNSRSHWRAKARDTSNYRKVAAYRVVLALGGQRPLWQSATILAQFYHAQARRRDDDNLIASLKSARDGLVDAGLLADDVGLTTLPIRRGIDRNNPRVELTITKTGDATCHETK